MLFKHGRRVGVGGKPTAASTLTPSMKIALHDLKLDRIVVVHPGDRRCPLLMTVAALYVVGAIPAG